MKALRWRIWFIVILSLLAAYSVTPTIIYFSLPKDVRNDTAVLEKKIPDWLPKKHIKLGLDLQGGVQLVLGVDTAAAIDNKLGRIATEISRWAKDSGQKLKSAYVLKGQQTLRVELENGVDQGAFKAALAKEFVGLTQSSREANSIDFKYNEDQMVRTRDAALEQAERVVRSRVDKWGVTEPMISRRADRSILVQLPGFRDPEKARELLGRTAQLKFKMLDEEFKGFESLASNPPPGVSVERRGRSNTVVLVGEDKQAILKAAEGLVPAGREMLFETQEIAGGKKTRYTAHVLHAATEISGEDVLDAFVTYDTSALDNKPVVSLQFTGPGGKRFGDVTGENVGKRMAIVLDDVVVSDPVINSRIGGGSAQITLGNQGGYEETLEEANQLALVLSLGALPAPITIMEERQVGATLGPELANQGVLSVLVGLAAVLLFLVAYYRRPGVIACIALTLNALFLLALMAGLGFALTLPGFAGFILTLGMAVDANVLINERIRQELREGKTAKKAVEAGFDKVFWTIVDANVTTLIAAVVLMETNPAGPIKGFSVALILGLLVSMFTSLFCSKVMFNMVLNSNRSDAMIRKWLGGDQAAASKVGNWNFLKWGKVATGIGVAIAIATLAFGAVKGMNWAVDFAGGTEIEIAFQKPIEPKEIRSVLESVGINDATMQSVGEGGSKYLIRFDRANLAGAGQQAEPGASPDKASAAAQSIGQALVSKLKDYGPDLQRVDFVGPLIGKELRKQGIQSVIWAMLGILLYIGLRFDLRFAPGAIAKMVLDTFLVISFYAFFWRSFDMTAVAALLTVVGYSVNDVIVIYDRIRENLVLAPRRTIYENINVALNETLGRSITTSMVTMISLLGILIFGTAQIWNFAVAMSVGVIAATLSSTFIASSCVLWFEGWKRGRANKVRTAAA